MDGHFAPATDGHAPPMWAIGPLARTPDDLALALDLLADRPLPRPDGRPPGEWRILLLATHPFAPLADAIHAALEAVGAALEAAGARVDRDAPITADLSAQFGTYLPFLIATLSRGFGQDGAMVELGAWFDFLDAQARATRAWSDLFTQYDAVIAPSFGVTAFPHDDTPATERVLKVDGRPTTYGAQLAFPALAAFPGLPATVVPVGRDEDGLPIGVQVFADHWKDHTAIAVANAVHALMAE
jgi:amidase